jgi:hypothetical protein
MKQLTMQTVPVQNCTEENEQHGGHKDNKYSNKRTLTISTTSGEAHGWQHHIGKNWYNRVPASGEYTITPKGGRVRPKHVDD